MRSTQSVAACSSATVLHSRFDKVGWLCPVAAVSGVTDSFCIPDHHACSSTDAASAVYSGMIFSARGFSGTLTARSETHPGSETPLVRDVVPEVRRKADAVANGFLHALGFRCSRRPLARHGRSPRDSSSKTGRCRRSCRASCTSSLRIALRRRIEPERPHAETRSDCRRPSSADRIQTRILRRPEVHVLHVDGKVQLRDSVLRLFTPPPPLRHSFARTHLRQTVRHLFARRRILDLRDDPHLPQIDIRRRLHAAYIRPVAEDKLHES